MDVMKLYNRMPAMLQNAAVSVEGGKIQRNRYGAAFQEQYRLYMNRNPWSYGEKCAYRDQQLQKMIRHCYFTVPYYRRVFDEQGIDYRDIQRLEDLSILPILDKQTVREHYDELFSSAFHKKELVRLHTSGSSGSGLIFYQNQEANAAVWAHVWRWYSNIGVKRDMWCAYFGGRSVVPKDSDRAPHYRINYPGKQIMFSVFHLKPQVYEEYCAVLQKYQPAWIQAYPSALTPLAQYILEHKVHLGYTPAVITLSSENVNTWQTEIITAAFGVLPLQNYAQSEAMASFYQGCDGKILVDEDFSAVEFVPLADGSSARIIGTTLTNYAMPFLRYDTKDLAEWHLTEAGREILSLDGREEDDIKLKDGGVIRRLSRIFQEQDKISEAQLVQKSYDLIEVRIVPQKGFMESDEAKLRQTIQEYLAGRISYKLVYRDALDRMKNGKLKFIVSEL